MRAPPCPACGARMVRAASNKTSVAWRCPAADAARRAREDEHAAAAEAALDAEFGDHGRLVWADRPARPESAPGPAPGAML